MPYRVQKESNVENYLKEQVEKRKGICAKFDARNYKGHPDRICYFPHGVFALVETKRPKGGRLSPAQRVLIARLKKMKQPVYVLWSKPMIDEWFKNEIDWQL